MRVRFQRLRQSPALPLPFLEQPTTTLRVRMSPSLRINYFALPVAYITDAFSQSGRKWTRHAQRTAAKPVTKRDINVFTMVDTTSEEMMADPRAAISKLFGRELYLRF